MDIYEPGNLVGRLVVEPSGEVVPAAAGIDDGTGYETRY